MKNVDQIPQLKFTKGPMSRFQGFCPGHYVRKYLFSILLCELYMLHQTAYAASGSPSLLSLVHPWASRDKWRSIFYLFAIICFPCWMISKIDFPIRKKNCVFTPSSMSIYLTCRALIRVSSTSYVKTRASLWAFEFFRSSRIKTCSYERSTGSSGGHLYPSVYSNSISGSFSPMSMFSPNSSATSLPLSFKHFVHTIIYASWTRVFLSVKAAWYKE